MWFLALACAFFLGIHLMTAGIKLKEQIVEGIGMTSYLILFSLFSIIGLIWMVFAFTIAVTDPLNIRFYDTPRFFHYLSVLPMFIAIMLIVQGYLSPKLSKSHMTPDKVKKVVYGIMRISRHPILAGVGIWAFLHLFLAGHLAAILFFGTLLALSILGANSIDEKKLNLYGDVYASVMRRTSIIPFNAILEGRTMFQPKELGIVKPFLALSVFCVFLALHEMLFTARVF